MGPHHKVAPWHAMSSGLITDIGKEASVARFGRFDVHCNLHEACAQFIQGATRVFDRQIDAS